MKHTLAKGSILGGRWNQMVYAGVDNAYVQQVLLDEQNAQRRSAADAGKRYADYLAGGDAGRELDLSSPLVTKQIREAEQLGLTRIYDGFSQPKVYKYE